MHFTVRSIPELSSLPEAKRHEIWQRCHPKAWRHWQTWFALLVSIGCLAAGFYVGILTQPDPYSWGRLLLGLLLIVLGSAAFFPVHVAITRRHMVHLNYDSFEAWAEGEGLPKDWTKHPDKDQRDLWWHQYAELKQHLWQRHVATLTSEERQEFEARSHPSLSHDFRERAQPFTEYLKEELARRGYNAEVRLGFYHLDRIVLNAVLDRTPPDRLRGVPWLFRGFEVLYRFRDTDAHNAA